MKQLFYIVLFFSCTASYAQEFVANRNITDTNILPAASGNQSVLICPPDIFKYAANRENNQHTFQRLLPNHHKFSAVGDLSITKTASKTTGTINCYAAHTENHAIRFEGRDIIHPFNYFW